LRSKTPYLTYVINPFRHVFCRIDKKIQNADWELRYTHEKKVVKLFIWKVLWPGIELLEELLSEGIFALEAEDHHPHVPSRGYFEPWSSENGKGYGLNHDDTVFSLKQI
jgi:hypothetical protein